MSEPLDLATLLRPQRREAAPPETVSATEGEPRRDAVEAAMNARCEVLRFVSLEDETGGQTTVWTQAGAYPCRIERVLGATESGTATGGQASQVLYDVHLPRTAQLQANDRIGVPGWFNVWKPNTAYTLGAKLISTAPRPQTWFECSEPGNSGAVEPVWPQSEGALVLAGSARFKCRGGAQWLEVVGVIDAVTDGDELIVRAKEIS